MNPTLPPNVERLLRKLRAAFHGFHLKDLRNLFFGGVVIAIPIIVTVWVLKIVYAFINGLSAPLLKEIFGHDIFGLGFVVTLVLLILLGVMGRNVIGKRVLVAVEKLLLRLPLVATIYTAVKQVVDSFKSLKNASTFKTVVYIDYPSEGCKLIGFVTSRFYDPTLEKEMVSVVLPTAPNPMTGLMVLVEASRVIESKMSIEEATKFLVSVGLVAPTFKVPTTEKKAPEPVKEKAVL